jgi:DNA-binding transcriptional ArsR family regulator
MAVVADLTRAGSRQRERLVTIFGALSDPTRLDMLQLILHRGEVGCVEFDQRFPLSKSTISYHTKILNAAGLIETRREGRFFFYRPVKSALEEALPGLAEQLRDVG